MPDTLILAAPNDDGSPGYTYLRVRCPEGLSRQDTYLHLLSLIPAGAPQPKALNLTDAPTPA